MTQPLGIDDFFSLEAGEYLDRLATLARGPGAPGADEVVRFTRALRGSALMANQQPIARAASGLEHLLRGYRDGRRGWDGELEQLVREAIDIIRTLVERVRVWSPEDTARCERLALQLESSAGGTPRAPAAPASPAGNETGVRAFLARESAALGSTLDQASRSLAGGTASPDLLQAVIRRMQPLRGLAALADYPPLPDLLDGVDRVVSSVAALELPARDGGERLHAAAAALARSARDIVDRGRPEADALEFRRFAELMVSAGPEEAAIVDIETLFFTGQEGIVQRGTAPRSSPTATLGAAAVVSRGEHLCQAADEIADATSGAQRDLRLHLLVSDLRTLSGGLPAPLDIAVESFAVSARAAVARGAAARAPGPFSAALREAGVRLRNYSEATQASTLRQAFEDLIDQLDGLGLPTTIESPIPIAAAAPVMLPVDDESDVVPIESLAPDEPEEIPIVPIETLAPEPITAPSRAIEIVEPLPLAAPAAGAPVAGGWDLAASWSYFEAGGIAVVEAAVVEPPVVVAPGRVTAPRMEPPAVRPIAAPEPELDVIEIASLVYRGRAALERADQVRREIRAAFSASAPAATLRPLMDELLDLVELAMVE